MYDFYIDLAWLPAQSIDIDKANAVANEVLEFQGYLTQHQVILCLGGAVFDEVIDHDIRVWEPKVDNTEEWFYPI